MLKQGDRFEALEDLVVRYVTQWDAPYTGGGRGTLERGETIVALEVFGENPPASAFRPLDYEAVEARLIPGEDRAQPKYDGFYILIDIAQLTTKFKRIGP